MEESGMLFCVRCGKEIVTGQGIKFIKFNETTLLFHKGYCYDKAKEAAQLKEEQEEFA